MAGAAVVIDYEFNDQRAVAAMRRLQEVGGDFDLMLKDIGEHLMISHDQRFRDQVDPSGQPWEPLSDPYRKRKKKNADKILIRDALLMNTLAYQIDGETLHFGTARVYGATHQFGDETRGIPQREFLGISASDEEAILDIVQQHLKMALGT